MRALPFEKPVVVLRDKIRELEQFTKDSDVDLSEEISNLKERLARLEEDVYGNMGTWDKVQVARHADRPTTRDYLPLLFDHFLEMKGDRLYGEDPAIIGGIGFFNERPVTVIGHQRGKDTHKNLDDGSLALSIRKEHILEKELKKEVKVKRLLET